MHKVRSGMFETNSSSAHSLVISGVGEQCPPSLTGTPLAIEPGEFGWGPETYHDWPTKASYCLTYAKQKNRDDLLAMLKDVLQQHTKAIEVEFRPCADGYYPWGHIDHQSIDDRDETAEAGVFDSPENLAQFIFNPRSILVIDNDNH